MPSVDPASPLALLLGIDPRAMDAAAIITTSLLIMALVAIGAYLAFTGLRDRMKDHRDGEWDPAAFDAATDEALLGWENGLDARRDGWRGIATRKAGDE